jgi:hypothetical protein
MRMRWTDGVCNSMHTNGVGNYLAGGWKEDTAFTCSQRAIRNVYTSIQSKTEYLNNKF